MLSVIREEDMPACAGIFKEIFTGEPWNQETVTTQNALRYIRDLSITPGFLGFVYHVDGQPAGMVLGTVNDYFFDPQYDIKELAVAVAYQRLGVGTRMLADVEAYLAARGVAFMLLQTSRMIPAYDFYIRNGYALVPETVNMAKEIKK